MLVLQKAYQSVCCLFLLVCASLSMPSANCYANTAVASEIIKSNDVLENTVVNKTRMKIRRKPIKLSYYLNVEDFAQSFIQIPTANVSSDSTTVSSEYLAGRAPLYNRLNKQVGTCSASFLCMQNANGIYTDISNYFSVDNGLIVTWFTPTTLVNLELDTIVNSMVTECLVVASTNVGFNPFYGKTFNMVVSSDSEKIYFKLTEVRRK